VQDAGPEAVRCAQAGQEAAARGPHRLRSLLAMRQARGYALAGDAAGMRTAAAHAYREYERAEPVAGLEWYNEAELVGAIGSAHAPLGDPPPALPLLHEAGAAGDPAELRNVLSFRARLAEVLARDGQVGDAAALAHDTVDRAAGAGVRSDRLVRQIHKIAAVLPGGPARDLADRLREERGLT